MGSKTRQIKQSIRTAGKLGRYGKAWDSAPRAYTARVPGAPTERTKASAQASDAASADK
jgi:hypothetical protein